VVAFCGLAYPQKFFTTLSSIGAKLVETKTFPDHYEYSDAEIDALALSAKNQDAMLVTTSKDAARMNARSLSLVNVVYVTLDFEKPDALMALIDKALKAS
jgi:tetraacyldisaccharide 4'-kinase